MSAAKDRAMVEFECNLTIAFRASCSCAPYLVRRRSVLIPAALAEAESRGEDPVDVFAEFARKLHEQKCGTFTAGRFAALMAAALAPAAEDDQ